MSDSSTSTPALPDLNELAARVHKANAKWWVDIETGRPIARNMGEVLMLVVSELSEALEGHRKNLMDDKLPHRPMVEVELADAYIRLLDVAGGFGFRVERLKSVFGIYPNFGENLIELTGTVVEMHRINKYRSDRHFDTYLSSALTQIEQLSAHMGYDLPGAFAAKMLYNSDRPDHKLENRRAEGGKKY